MLFPRKIVGLDIGSHSIKFVVLKKGKKGMSLLNLGYVLLPNESIVDSEIENPEAVTDAITTIFKMQKIKRGDVVASLAGQSLVIKKINLPKMTPKELEEAISSEAEQYLPFDIDEVNLDFQAIKDKISDEKGEEGEDIITTDVLLVAARQEVIEARKQVILDAGFDPIIFDFDVFALENLYEINYGKDVEGVVALVNMGAGFTNVNILVDGITDVTKDIPNGGNKINHDIQKAFNVNAERSEELKKGINPGDISKEELAVSINESLREICHDVNKMFHEFYKNSEREVEKVYFSGGCANIIGIGSILVDNFDIEVELIDPFKMIEIDEKGFNLDYINEIAPLFAVATGLALRDFDDKGLE